MTEEKKIKFLNLEEMTNRNMKIFSDSVKES